MASQAQAIALGVRLALGGGDEAKKAIESLLRD